MLSVGRRRLLSTEGFVFGQVADKALDMTRVRVGQKLDVPYELTISTGFRDIWHSTFYQHDRVYTSDSYARSLGFDQALLPFSMLLSITGSMTHVDDRLEVLDLGFRNAVYRRPAYPGDTFYKTFYISGIRETSESQNSIVTVHCDLSDANTSETVFSVDKIMMYPIQRRQNTYAAGEPSHTHFNSQVKDQIVSNYSYMSTSSTLSGLTPGQLLLHGMCRPMGRSTAMELATLLRWTHPLLYNLKRYDFDELVVAGGLVLASAHACSARYNEKLSFWSDTRLEVFTKFCLKN
jgi:acyl dehydratase